MITSVSERVKVSEVLKPMSTEIATDHSAIIFDLSLSHIPSPKIKRTVFDYRRADFDGLRFHIQSLDLDKLISDHGKIEHDWFACKKSFMNAVADFVPTKNLRSRHHLPWVDSLILHNIKEKNSLRKKIKRSSSPSEHRKKGFEIYVQISNACCVKAARNTFNSICTSREHNPKRFWSFFKLKSKVSHIPGKVSRRLNEGEGKRRSYAENSIDIANTFNEYFASIFTQDTDNLA